MTHGLFNKLNSKLVSSFSYLLILQIFLTLVPILTYPYLIRMFGADSYGEYVFYYTIASFSQVIINYGFDLSATKKVAEHNNDTRTLGHIFTCVTSFKCYVFSILVIILLTLYYAKLITFKYDLVFAFILGSLFLDALFPNWLFLGLQNPKLIPIFGGGAKMCYVAMIYCFIDSDSSLLDLAIALFITSLVYVISSIVYIRYRLDIPYVGVTFDDLVEQFTSGGAIFISRISGIINVKLAALTLGFFGTSVDMAYYDLAQRLIDLCRVPINILNQVIYPIVVKERDIRLPLKAIVLSIIYSVIMVSLLFLFGKQIIQIFAGDNMRPAYSSLVILSLLVPISSISWILGDSVLVAFGKNKLFLVSVLSGVGFIFAALFILLINDEVTLNNICISLVCTSLFITVFRVYLTKKNFEV